MGSGRLKVVLGPAPDSNKPGFILCIIVQVHAACNGVWGYRASTGAGTTDSSGRAAGALDALGWASRDPKSLQLVADALSLPGSEFHLSNLH